MKDPQQSLFAVLVSLDTSLDKHNVNRVRTMLNKALERGHYRLVIDLTATENIDENGMTLLVDIALEMKARYGTLALIGVRPDIHFKIEESESHELFRYFIEVESALNALQTHGLS
jgi:anti-anti-sigma factor